MTEGWPSTLCAASVAVKTPTARMTSQVIHEESVKRALADAMDRHS